MKLSGIVSVLLLFVSLIACTKPDQPPPVSGTLNGDWTGTYETQQTGSCAWSGPTSETIDATWQVTNDVVIGTVSRKSSQYTLSTRYTGSIKGSDVNVSESKNASCFGTPRTYTARYQGTISGNTLTLVSSDTICPTENCVFRRTIKLTR